MKVNPSLTARLRIGFAVLFALLLAVSLLGVGRLFQVRVDYEDEITRYYDLELQGERLRSAFILEQAAIRAPAPGTRPNPADLRRASDSFAATADVAADLTGGDEGLTGSLDRMVAAEATWRKQVGVPRVQGRDSPGNSERQLTAQVTTAGEELTAATRDSRDGAQQRARDDTRDTAILVGVGLLGALLAALILFSGLINSMRAPLARLVSGARRVAGGDLEARVETGGPVEIEALGRAFNEMATSLERDAQERDRIEQMKDDFVLTVSHELRTPVTVVKGFAEMLIAEKRLSANQREAAEVIAESASQLQGLIEDLLDLARSDAGKLRINPEPTPVRPLLQRVGRQIRPSFEEKNQKLTVSVEKSVPEVQADPDRIGQVLSNLLVNANRYSPEGCEGPPERLQKREERRIRGRGHGTRPRQGPARARVRALLAGGERRDPDRRGHRSRARDHQIPGRGARRLDLCGVRARQGDDFPLQSAHREVRNNQWLAPHPANRLAIQGWRRVTRLLVADDSETVLLMLRRRLEMSGYEVLTATDGQEAVARVEEAGGELDLLLLDAMMPGKSGIDALREIRASGVKTPALIISAHLDAQEPELLEEIGADGCVPKPFEWENLLERIDELAGP